jgi:superfamily II DNA helicase RecQ
MRYLNQVSRFVINLLIIRGTGGGKSLVFMLCAMNKDEDRLTTIVIVPLVALAQDLVCHLRGMKIHIAMWSNTTSYYSAQVTIAVSKTATSKAGQENQVCSG